MAVGRLWPPLPAKVIGANGLLTREWALFFQSLTDQTGPLSAITDLTGDVTATGPGSAVATLTVPAITSLTGHVTATGPGAAAATIVNPWASVAYADCTFTAQSGNWTVASGDLSYYRYAVLDKVAWIRGAVVTSTVTATPTELRVTAPPGLTFATNDAFGYAVVSQDGFATQDSGQAIARVSSGLLAFKPRVGGTWATTADLTAVIWNLVAEIA